MQRYFPRKMKIEVVEVFDNWWYYTKDVLDAGMKFLKQMEKLITAFVQ